MANAKRVLVLHVVGGGDPLRIALTPEDASAIEADLSDLLLSDTPGAIKAADGTTVVVNFAHVAAALVTTLAPGDWAYGTATAPAASFA